MDTKPRISIIVPIYNEGNHIAALIEHLHGLASLQEVILVDASDQPQAKSIVAESVLAMSKLSPESVKITLVTSDKSGRAVQMNLGAQYSNGDILVFLHCDTRLPDDAIRLIRQVVENGVQWGRFDIALDCKGLIYRIIERMMNLRSRVRSIATGDQAMFIAADLFNQCDGYPEIALMEDIAICQKLNRHCRPGLIKKSVRTSARRWQNKGALATILLMWKLRLLFWLGVDSTRLASMYRDER